MRIPKSKIYRAFPELDEFSDAQCERFMQRIEVSGFRKGVPLVAFLIVFGLSGLLVIILSVSILDAYYYELIRSGNEFVKVLLILTGMLLFLPVPPMSGLLARDVLLRRNLELVINEKLERIRCLDCRYVLIGQIPENGKVTCSECGRVHLLSRLGIVADDLIPPEMDDPTGHSYV